MPRRRHSVTDDPMPAWARAMADRILVHIDEGTADLETRLGAHLDERFANAMTRLDRLQQDLERRLEEEVVKYSDAQRAQRLAQSNSDEVRLLAEQVVALTGLVRRLESEVRQLRSEQ